MSDKDREAFKARYGDEPFTKDEAGMYERSVLRKGYFDGFSDALASQAKEIEEVRELLRSGTEDFNKAAAAQAAKDAEIERLTRELDVVSAIQHEPCCATQAEIERLKGENDSMAADYAGALLALQPFNDAFVEANKWSMPYVQYSEHTAQAILTGCINAVTLDDFKNAARACKSLADAQQEG